MAFQQGLSGLNAAAKSLDVIGNNIANSGTVGFKQSQTQFADIYARSLNGVGGATAGIGVAVGGIAQQFTQGNIETSANPLDIAINGAGFFRTSVNGAIQYSRNGQFQLDKDGFMVNAQLAQLTGYLADSKGKIMAGAPVPIQIDPTDMPPNATTSVKTQLTLNSESQQPITTPFNAEDTTSYNKQIPTEVYDSLGNAHVMSSFYVKTGVNNWDVYIANDGLELASAAVAAAPQTDQTSIDARVAYQVAATTVPLDPQALLDAGVAYAQASGAAMLAAAGTAGADQSTLDAITAAMNGSDIGSKTPDQIDAQIAAAVNVPAVRAGALVFTTSGALDKTAMLLAGQTIPIALNLPLFPATGGVNPLKLEFDLTGTTQISAATNEKKTVQDGFSGGALTTFASGADGTIIGQYSNGRTRALAQIVLANFTNPNGLESLGNNAWRETASSGVPLVGQPDSGTLGLLRSSATEASNVDLTAELVNMITAQRAYQANAQTIKTQDSVMQTLVNLR